ncbi:MAG: O-antigen ligase family protein [Candidatus Eisenbacteria bacterium]
MTARSSDVSAPPPLASRDWTSVAAGAVFLLWLASGYWTIAPMSIASGLAAMALFVSRYRGRSPGWNRSPADAGAAAWALAMILSAAFALDRSASFARLGKLLFPLLVGLAAWHARDPVIGRRAIAVLLVSCSLSAVFGLAGFMVHGASFASRARGPVGHYLTFAGQLAIGAALAIAIALVVRDRRWRWAAAVCAALAISALAATYTRSSWLGLIGGSALMLALTRPLALVPLGLAVALLAILAPGDFRERLWSSFDLSSRWNEQRQYMWQAGARMFRDHPLTGVGLQDLRSLYEQYRPPAATESAGHLHSVPVHVAATMGLVGLAALVVLLVSLARTAGAGLRARLRRGGLSGAVSLGALGALAAFVVAGLFEWNLGDEEVLHPLYALIGLAWAARSWGEEPAGVAPLPSASERA